jgi:HK97 gp10 family phage protein
MAKQINIVGGKELAEFLKTLPAKLERNVMRGALRAGAKVIADEAKANVPTRMGALKKSIRVSSKLKKGEVTASAKAGNKKVFYAGWVEFGTAPHKIVASKMFLRFIAKDGNVVKTKSVNHTGAVSKPFMRPALDTKAAQSIQEAGRYIKQRMTKEGLDAPDITVSEQEE